MRKLFVIDGGAGRAIAAIPALEKYAKAHPNEDWYVFIFGWDNLLWGNKILQKHVYNPDTRGVWESIVRDATEVISPEPYRVPGYFRQELSLAEAFDVLINDTNDHSDLEPPRLYLNKMEEKTAANVIADARQQQGKEKTIVIQPYGRSAQVDRGDIIDDGTRSLPDVIYLEIVNRLAQKYNTIFFGEEPFSKPEDPSLKPQGDLRLWAAIVESADYFVGIDSVGQHMARAFNKKGTVICGSTFPINTSYPDHFQIWENKDVEKFYNPIRLCGLDGHLADRLNDTCMDLTEKQINELYNMIVKDIEKK